MRDSKFASCHDKKRLEKLDQNCYLEEMRGVPIFFGYYSVKPFLMRSLTEEKRKTEIQVDILKFSSVEEKERVT